jgi:hypothetical protein
MSEKIGFTHFKVEDGQIAGYDVEGPAGLLITRVLEGYEPYSYPAVALSSEGYIIAWVTNSNFYTWYINPVAATAGLVPFEGALDFFGSMNQLRDYVVQDGELRSKALLTNSPYLRLGAYRNGIDIIAMTGKVVYEAPPFSGNTPTVEEL